MTLGAEIGVAARVPSGWIMGTELLEEGQREVETSHFATMVVAVGVLHAWVVTVGLFDRGLGAVDFGLNCGDGISDGHCQYLTSAML